MALRSLTEGLASESDLEQVANLLAMILSRLPIQEPTNNAWRVNPIGGTVSVVTTVSSLTNQTQQGGILTNNDQQVQFAIAAGQLRNRITVT